MTAIIDTSSLMAIVRYYLPFDQNDRLKSLIQSHFDNGSLIVIDRVFDEARLQAKGIIIKDLGFLKKESKRILNTDSILPDKAFFNMLENQFCNKELLRSKGIDDAGFEKLKNTYLEEADAKIVLYARHLTRKGDLLQSKILVVTEESISSNDGKPFKKIPVICSHLNIECCTLPTLLKEHYTIKFGELLG
jgi:hypothetical protein